MDIFTWSIPFVVEKISDIFCNILKPGSHDEDSDKDDEMIKQKIGAAAKPKTESPDKNIPAMKLSEKGNKLRNKIKFVARMAILQKNLRQTKILNFI